MEKLEVLQAIYDSEINLQISWLWDAGIDWKIWDELNWWEYSWTDKDLDIAVVKIAKKCIELYPDSEFAKNFTVLF